MDFFSKCKTEHEVKALFRRLSKLFHPDTGGESELMIELRNQYDNWSFKSPFDTYRPLQQTREEVFGSSYSYNPRIETLERELRLLRQQLKDGPNIIFHLRAVNNSLSKVVYDLKVECEEHAEEYNQLEDENLKLKIKIEELEKTAIVKDETTDTLWDKIKYVMGNKSKKAYK